MGEFREALRLNPNDEWVHYNFGLALEDMGEADGALNEYREALRLDPKDDDAHVELGRMLGNKGDEDGAIGEYREALRLNPNNVSAHRALGNAFGTKGDLDGAIAEARAAVELFPKNPSFHFDLAGWLEKKGDQEGALGEYRTAYLLYPPNVTLKTAYENFLQRMNADKLQHWLGTWVFAGPVKYSIYYCGGKYVHSFDLPNYAFKVLAINPSGEVTAQVPEGIHNSKPNWSGTATDTSLVLTPDPIPVGGLSEPKEARGRLEVHRYGDRYSVDFGLFEAWSTVDVSYRFLGEMRRP
jgi:tetratricopeptide (TPR) repeat protein